MSEESRVHHAEALVLDAEASTGPGWLQVSGGRIVAFGEGEAPRDLGPVERGPPGSVLLPGFVNPHVHLVLGHLKALGDGLSLPRWIEEAVKPAMLAPEAALSLREGARRSARELLDAGFVYAADGSFRREGPEAMREAGLPGLWFQELFGAFAPDLEAYWANLRFGPHATEDQDEDAAPMPWGYAPHAPWTCPPELIVRVAERAAAEQRLVSLHLSECLEEEQLFREGRGSLAEQLRTAGTLDRIPTGQGPVALLDELGVLRKLGERLLAVHCVTVDGDAIARLAAAGTVVVHCPRSNAWLGEGVAPVAALREAGVPVVLGTDSAASAGTLDPFSEMRAYVRHARAAGARACAATAAEAFSMLTVGPARVLGLPAGQGTLAPGAPADFVRVALDRPRHGSLASPLAALLWTASAADVIDTHIAGQRRGGARA